jgi:hypothetical protein
MGDWLAATLDLGFQTADRLWLLARTDEDIRQHLAEGKWGLDRSAALAKLRQTGATPEQFREAADNYTLGRIHALTDRLRRIDPELEQQTASDRFLVVQPDLGAQMMKLWGLLPAADGETVLTALDRKETTFPVLPDQNSGQRRADALVAICADSLTGDQGDGTASGAGLVADIFIDAVEGEETAGEAGAVTRRGLKAGPGLLEEILCAGKVRAIATDGLRPVAVTDATSPIPPSVRAYIWWRDMGQCAIDGCRSRYRLQPHHIKPRSRGGDHHPHNLTLLCWYHHHIAIHLLGMTLDPTSPPGRRRLVGWRTKPPPPLPPPNPIPIATQLTQPI